VPQFLFLSKAIPYRPDRIVSPVWAIFILPITWTTVPRKISLTVSNSLPPDTRLVCHYPSKNLLASLSIANLISLGCIDSSLADKY